MLPWNQAALKLMTLLFKISLWKVGKLSLQKTFSHVKKFGNLRCKGRTLIFVSFFLFLFLSFSNSSDQHLKSHNVAHEKSDHIDLCSLSD